MNTAAPAATTKGDLVAPKPRRSVTDLWPAVVGVLSAMFAAFGSDAADAAPIVTASGFVYLRAAALGRRTAAWPMFFLSFVVIGSVSVMDLGPTWATVAMLAIAGVLVGRGLVRGGLQPWWGLPL